MSEYREQLESYNQAVRDATRREIGRPTLDEVLAKIPPGADTYFKWLQESINEEYNAIQAFLDGKMDKRLDEPRLYVEIKNGILYDGNPLTYFKFPNEFDEYVASLMEGNEEEFSDIEKAWIKNTKELLGKYHAQIYKNEADSEEVVA